MEGAHWRSISEECAVTDHPSMAEKLERKTGAGSPGTNSPVEFTYRLAQSL